MKSDELKQKISQEDNDITAFGLQCKLIREKRSEKFVEDYLPLLSSRFNIATSNGKYTITTEQYGILDFFPKANKILIRKDNKWIKPGLSWIRNNLLI